MLAVFIVTHLLIFKNVKQFMFTWSIPIMHIPQGWVLTAENRCRVFSFLQILQGLFIREKEQNIYFRDIMDYS